MDRNVIIISPQGQVSTAPLADGSTDDDLDAVLALTRIVDGAHVQIARFVVEGCHMEMWWDGSHPVLNVLADTVLASVGTVRRASMLPYFLPLHVTGTAVLMQMVQDGDGMVVTDLDPRVTAGIREGQPA